MELLCRNESRKICLIGVIHLGPMPGAAGYRGSVSDICDKALQEAHLYEESGFDALIVENTFDAPYLKGFVYPETVAAMTRVCSKVKEQVSLPVGVQLLAGANRESLSVALACGLEFIRVEGFVYAHIGDEGLHQASAPDLVRRRFELDCPNIKIYADIKKKHSAHSITADVDLVQTAKDAAFFQADGLVITGISTGCATSSLEVRAVSDAVSLPVLVGSGVTLDNIESYIGHADALIIGSSVKENGDWRNALSSEKCRKLVEAATNS